MVRPQFSLRTLLVLTFAVGVSAGTFPWWYPQLGILTQVFHPVESRPIPWRACSPELFVEAKSSGMPVLLYFDADWDASSKVTEAVALEQPQTRRAIAASGVLPMRVDLTNYSVDARKIAREYHEVPITPMIIVDSPASKGGPIILTGVQSPKSVVAAICSATSYDPAAPSWDPFQSPLVGIAGLLLGLGIAHLLARKERRQAAASSVSATAPSGSASSRRS